MPIEVEQKANNINKCQIIFYLFRQRGENDLKGCENIYDC